VILLTKFSSIHTRTFTTQHYISKRLDLIYAAAYYFQKMEQCSYFGRRTTMIILVHFDNFFRRGKKPDYIQSSRAFLYRMERN